MDTGTAGIPAGAATVRPEQSTPRECVVLHLLEDLEFAIGALGSHSRNPRGNYVYERCVPDVGTPSLAGCDTDLSSVRMPLWRSVEVFAWPAFDSDRHWAQECTAALPQTSALGGWERRHTAGIPGWFAAAGVVVAVVDAGTAGMVADMTARESSGIPCWSPVGPHGSYVHFLGHRSRRKTPGMDAPQLPACLKAAGALYSGSGADRLIGV